MKRTGIIGLGTITKYYLKGLKASDCLSLAAVCDELNRPVSLEYFEEFPFYYDYKEMIEKENLEYVIISTPPKSHYDIAMYALKMGVNVIIEKPAVLDIGQYEDLLETARSNGVIFEVMYHWQNGSEVIAFNEEYNSSKISEIHVTVLDPYSDDGKTINVDKIKLCGAWVDSGVNILSMIKTWLPFETFELESFKLERCQQTDLPIAVSVNLKIDGVTAYITVDWTQHINNKSSYVIYDGRKVEIKHSEQVVVDGDFCRRYDDMERLQHHYFNYFKNYKECIDVSGSYKIHSFLLKINDRLG